MIKIVLDAFGGDNSPQANLDGALKALKELPDLHLTIVGDEATINTYPVAQFDPARVTVVHAPDVISCDESRRRQSKTKKTAPWRAALNCYVATPKSAAW